ncbi:MAG: HTH-type transcriptional regulator / antitoxin HigA [Tenuifilum sp.]|jgi:addiction module HigA family antidote|uniref:HigA family addiction module antitoxin n=1 Tax=Tenuifilum sp. TaxID=2760880 RepID=UPI0024AB0744|nr:HigA family addiction module antitoxin [Tenuifilum sp.]MDI3527425.1 HTH-type transcriptional regulator / antitoxin HigA [Tenuifilum sp.]
MRSKYTYQPDYAVHPGETLREKLEELAMTPKEFAVRTGKPIKTISEILNGKSSITSEMAVLFEKVLKIPANFWIRKQANFNEFIAREKHKEEIAEATEWAKRFPYPQMAKIGLVKATRRIDEKAEELLHFFNISKPSAWENIYLNQQTPVFFRISLKHSKDPYALSALFRMGEIKAESIDAPDFNKSVLKSILPDLKNIMANKPSDFLQQIQNKCLQAGVKVIYTPNLPKTVIHGTVRWLNDKPVLQITDRLKRYDIFWFSLFHEIGHILLHGNKKNIFLEEIKNSENKDQKEQEADEFAAQWLLSHDEYAEIVNNINPEKDILDVIRNYANKFGTHKDVIIGRILFMNNDLYKYGFLQKEIEKVDFEDIFNAN